MPNSRPSSLEEIRNFVQAAGYTLANNITLWGPRDLWYEKTSSRDSVRHVILLEYKNITKAYGFSCGIYSVYADKLLPAARSVILESVNNPISFAMNPMLYWPCWSMFDIGRALWSPLFSIPDPLDRDAWRYQLKNVEELFLKPIFWPIDSAVGIITLLNRDDKPFDWSATITIMRMSQIICTAKVEGFDAAKTRRMLQKNEKYLINPMYISTIVPSIVDSLIRSIYNVDSVP